MSAGTDEELLAAHVGGDPDAFAELVRRHRDRLWAVALRTLGDREEAADALQDALVNAYRRAEGFRGEAAVTTWLHRVVVNACLDRARRQAVRQTAPLSEDDHRTEIASPPERDPAEQAALRGDVAAALATLPPEQRAALVLVDMQGFSVEEAARVLGCAEGTVKSRCARGRARLLPLLAPGRRSTRATPATDGDDGHTTVLPATGNPAAPPAVPTQDGPERDGGAGRTHPATTVGGEDDEQ